MTRRNIITGSIVSVLVIVLILIFYPRKLKNDMIIGTTFNYELAQFLGLDPRTVFKTIVEDWHFKYIRLSAQWDLIEKEPGHYDFQELDWMMNEAKRNGVKIMLALGNKTPRWPECHPPGWTKDFSDEEYYSALRMFVENVVERYKDHAALEIWQVENEPFLPFGVCRPFTQKQLTEEISLVKKIDPHHPTLTSDSGELSTWRKTARAADLFGTTMYRVVWNKHTGYWKYDWVPATLYTTKLWLNQRSKDTAYIVELQAEPWIPQGSMLTASLDEQAKSMDLERLKKHIAFAKTTGMGRAYLWGAEWWYWLKEKKQVSGFGEYIKGLPKE